MFSIISQLLGYDVDPAALAATERPKTEETNRLKPEQAARPHACTRTRRDSSKPYNGRPTPKKALMSPDAETLTAWHDEWQVVLAANRTDALVFSTFFLCECSPGEVAYDEMDRRVHETDQPLRLADTIAIHKRLAGERGEEHSKRIIRFLGSPSPASYTIELPPSAILTPFTEPDPGAQDDDTVLALYQRWALQYLAACKHAHAKGVILNAPPRESTWLRADFSLVVAGLVSASCRELDIAAGSWAQDAGSMSPFGPSGSRSTEAPFSTAECGSPKTDLFNWACWVYGLMTGGRHPLVPLGEWPTTNSYVFSKEGRERGRAAREGRFDDWPVLGRELLGSCLVRAWKGGYESADDALRDVRGMLEGCGRVLSGEDEDEIDGFDWEAEFEYDRASRRLLRSQERTEAG